MRRFLAALIIISCAFQLACGKKEKSKAQPPAPCTQGVDAENCGLDVKEHSIWFRHYDVTKLDAVTKKTSIEKGVTVLTEFVVINGQQLWRRSSTVTNVDDMHPRTMIIQGQVQKIDATKIYLTIDQTSCDEIDSGFKITIAPNGDSVRQMYYQRHGQQLRLRTSEFPKPVTVTSSSKGIDGIIGSLIVTMVATAVQTVAQGMIEGVKEVGAEAFSSIFMRDQLRDGIGDFKAHTESQLADFSTGTIGCFHSKNQQGQEFTPSSSQILNW